MIASQARLKSKLIEKGATLPSAPMRRKQVSGSTEVQQLPRLREYAPGTNCMALWLRDVRKAASGVSKGKRAQSTSDEHDRNMWALKTPYFTCWQTGLHNDHHRLFVDSRV